MKFRNLTPHVVNIVNDNGQIIRTFPSEGVSLRVATNEPIVDNIDGINVARTTYNEVLDLPKIEADTYLIVSILVLQAMKNTNRIDLLAPNTSPNSCVRNEKGQIIGVKNFTILV